MGQKKTKDAIAKAANASKKGGKKVISKSLKILEVVKGKS